MVTPGDGSLNVDWDPPTDDGGADITHHNVQHKLSAETSWPPSDQDNTTKVLGVTNTSATIRGLLNGVEYSVQVRACNRDNPERCGAWSEDSGTPQEPFPQLGARTISVGSDGKSIDVGYNLPSASFHYKLVLESSEDGTSYTEEKSKSVASGSTGLATQTFPALSPIKPVYRAGIAACRDSSHDVCDSIMYSSTNVSSLARPIIDVKPLPLRKAEISWTGDTNASEYVVEIREPISGSSKSMDETTTSLEVDLDDMVSGKGLADADEYVITVTTRDMRTPRQYLDNSDTATVIDNPILNGGWANGHSPGSSELYGQVELQWDRIVGADEYSIEYRWLGRDHTQLDWPSWNNALEEWPYYEEHTNSPETFSPTGSDPESRTIDYLIRIGEIYAFQVNYVTISGEKVFSARDAYAWPSKTKPGNAKLVGTYTFFGHHPSNSPSVAGEYNYTICKDTFPPDDPNTQLVDENTEWVEIIKDAFGQWETATNGFVRMTPMTSVTPGLNVCQDDSTPISDFIKNDDEQNEVRMFNLDESSPGGGSIYEFNEFKSDVFKICVSKRPACVTSFIGYSGIGYIDKDRRRIADVVQAYNDGVFSPVGSWIAIKLMQAEVVAILQSNLGALVHERKANNVLQGVDVSFKQSAFSIVPIIPEEVSFNACVMNGIPDAHDDSRWNNFYTYATAVHEAGHALGLSNINFFPVFYQPDSAAHPTIPDAVMNYDSDAKSGFSPWPADHSEPDCSPHPFDVMAIYALYQAPMSPP